jgi:hypothetical protein
MMQHLKLIAAACQPDQWEGLRLYAKSRLWAKPGSDLTVSEIHSDYLRYAARSKIGSYPLCRFQRQLPKALEELFGAVRSHNLRRQHGAKLGWRRGFNGLAFRPDGTDNTDAPDGQSKNSTHVTNFTVSRKCSQD